jgi:hypothetical protein
VTYDEPLPTTAQEEAALDAALPGSTTLYRVLRLSADILVPAAWVALIIAIVLFSGVVSQFRYVDF